MSEDEPRRGTGSRRIGVPAGLRLEIFVTDLNACVDFYTRVLGFVVIDRRDEYVAFVRDSVRIGAVPVWEVVDKAARSVPTGVEIVIEVDDVRVEAEQVRAAGWPLETDLGDRAWGLTDFRVHDPDGYYLRLTSRSAVDA
jgi:catechol 2,3-dioxygenase-like lactoylglutathione lyase family enzyme